MTEQIEYMEVYLCDDWNRGLILIPVEPKKMSERIDAMRVIADWVEQFGWTAYYNTKK